jgi:ABC-type phosphate transport system substrate-binding protein
MPLQLQMGAFVLCTLALLCAFVPLSPTAAAAAPLSAGEGPLLRGSCTNIPTGFMSDVALAYSVAHPEVTLEQEVLLSPAAQASQFGNVTDYTVITAVISAANANANPDMLLLPLFTYALIPVYNLPLNDSTPHPQLVLTRSVLARIFRGNITRWSHPAIQSSNPGFLLPEEDITIVFTLTASGQQWATGLALFDAPFLAAIGGNPKSPVWPKNLFAAWKQVDTLVRTTATVAQTPYSISWSTFDVASAGGIAMGQ